jgi:hypothetical protein
MSRARKFGALTAVLACAGLVAGCGGGGYTAAESAPGTNGATTPTSTTPAAPGPETALGAYAPTDVAEAVETFKGYQQFPKERAGKIFVDPTVKPAPPPAAAPQASALAAAVTSVPVTAAPTTTAPAATTVTPTPVAAKTYVATLDVSGAAQAVKVGDAVPAAAPQFTVQAVTDAKVTLKLNSGTLPGGGTTIEIAVGESVTLSNPSTGASYVVKVTAIKPQA